MAVAGLFNVRVIVVSLLLTVFLCASQVAGGELGGNEMIAGGANDVAVDSPEVTKLAKVVTDKLSEGDNKERKVVQVLKASRQVVSGTLTHLKLKISDGDVERLYEASIWEQPWLNKTEITKLEPVDDDTA